MKVLFAGPDPMQPKGSGVDRPEGVHLSDILVRMAWEKNQKYHPDAPKNVTVFEQGFLWEAVLERVLAGRDETKDGFRPDALQEDGVWLSPDWVGHDGVAEEFKSTKKSSNSLDQKLDEWAPQGKAYVRVLLRQKLIKRPVMRWRIWCVMGDWSFENKTSDLTLLSDRYKVEIEFDRRELEENWQGILAYGRKAGLIPQEKRPWDDRPRLNQRMAERARKASGRTPPRSPRKAPVSTFPSGRASSRSSAVS